MMGRLEPGQERLFYNFRLEDQVPPNHLVRKLDALLDFEVIRDQLEPFYSEIGRPSVDPELMIRMLLIGYCYSIRSERKLCEEVRFNLAYKWFCGLGLEAVVPHHSTFSVNRHGRFRESEAFRLLFESVVGTCMKVGLVGGEGFAVDASVIEADASRYERVEGSEVDWTDEQKASRPVQEYLTALDTENSPINPDQKPKAMSPSDPAAAWTTRGRHKVQFAYSINHLIDLQDGVIIDVEATPTRISKEVDAAEIMLDRTRERFDLDPDRITADVAGACPCESGGHGRAVRETRRARYHAPYPGVGSEREGGERQVHPRRLRLRQGKERLRLSQRQRAPNLGHGSWRHHTQVRCQKERLRLMSAQAELHDGIRAARLA